MVLVKIGREVNIFNKSKFRINMEIVKKIILSVIKRLNKICGKSRILKNLKEEFTLALRFQRTQIHSIPSFPLKEIKEVGNYSSS